jgi:uncharacterized membrane protein YeiH
MLVPSLISHEEDNQRQQLFARTRAIVHELPILAFLTLRKRDPVMYVLPLVLDLVGTFVFAISGAAAGVQGGLDLFGVLVLSFAASNAGGITRDVPIGAVPPGAISDWRYLGASVLAGLTTFYWYSLVDRLRSPVLVFDAAGLALFAVTGTQKALT